MASQSLSMVLSEEQKMLQGSAAQFFAEQLPIEAFRAKRAKAGVARVRAEEWRQMVELGWSSILVPEELGGLAFGVTGLGMICIEAAKTLAPTHLVNTSALAVIALNACQASEQRDAFLSAVAEGNLQFSVLEPNHKEALNFVPEGMSANKLITFDGEVKIFDLNRLKRHPVGLIDQRDYARVSALDIPAESSLATQDGFLEKLTAAGATFTACELYGLSAIAFEQTLAYLKEREQFGQKIGAFQALQHRMAKAYMQVEMLKSVVLDSLHALETDRDDAPLAASHAKVLANQTAQLITTEAIQMHGGMGITDELDIGLFYKRARVLQSMWGTTAHHKQRFADLSHY